MDVSIEGTSKKKLTDLDTSSSSIEEEAELAKSQLKEAKKKIKALEEKVSSYEETFAKLEKIGKFFVREKTGGTSTYGHDICKLIFQFLADGRDSTVIVNFFERFVETLPVLLDVNLGENSEMPRSVPKETFVRKLRNGISYLNKEYVREFILGAKELTIACDDSPSPDGKTNYTAVGAFNESGDFCCIGYYENNDKSGPGIQKIVRDALIATGQLKEIQEKIRKQGATAMVTDTCAAQKRANRLLMEFFGIETATGKGISCLMHLG